jgi:hypothetical protein
VPQTVGPPDVQQANALTELSVNITAVLGPALAGVMVAGIGAGWALAFDGASFLIGVGFLALMRLAPVIVPARTTMLAAHAPLGVIVVFALIDGVSGTLFNLLWYTALQRDVPRAELSRVASWDYLGSLVLLPVGQLATGPIAEAIGVSTTLYAAGGLFVVLLLVVLAVPSVRNFTGESAAAGFVRVFRDRPGRTAAR